ncbi:MAG: hypothetical protein WAZ94_13410 [Phycisphaerales bacterium]
MRGEPKCVEMWLPRADEHALAASLGLCERDPEVLRQLVHGAQEQVARDLPGAAVRVHRWHVWRVVRAMHRVGVENTPAGRATAYVYLAVGGDREAGK